MKGAVTSMLKSQDAQRLTARRNKGDVDQTIEQTPVEQLTLSFLFTPCLYERTFVCFLKGTFPPDGKKAVLFCILLPVLVVFLARLQKLQKSDSNHKFTVKEGTLNV